MPPSEIIASLRASLSHAQSLTAALAKKHPDIYKKLLAGLPPPPSLAVPGAVVPGAVGASPPASEENSTSVPSPVTAKVSSDKEGSDKAEREEEGTEGDGDSEAGPEFTEEDAGGMIAGGRSEERDLFFKARIASGINDEKTFDLGPKVDCEKAVEAAVAEAGSVGCLNVARAYPEEEGVARRALKRLAGFSTDGKERETLGERGAVRLVVDCMERYGAASPGVAHFGTRTLGNLTFSNDDNRAQVGVVGVQAILAAMSSHASNAALQADGCSALTNVAHGNDANKRTIAAQGGVEVILNAMEEFLGEVKVQRAACWALLTIAGDTVAAGRAASDGAVGALLAAMVNFETEEDVQHFAVWGLLNVSLGSDALAKFVVDSGGVQLAQRSVSNFDGHVGIREKATAFMKAVDAYIVKEEL